MANQKGHIESLGTVPLAEGEQSKPVRVRAEAWVFDALKGRSAADVGQLLASALHDSRSSENQLEASVLRATQPRYTLEEWQRMSSRGEEAAVTVKAATDTALEDMEEAPSLEGFTSFRVISADISDKFRRRLRWSSEAYRDLQRQLEQGDTIRLVRGTWKTALGETVAVKRVARAYQFGNLEPLT